MLTGNLNIQRKRRKTYSNKEGNIIILRKVMEWMDIKVRGCPESFLRIFNLEEEKGSMYPNSNGKERGRANY